MTVQLGGQKVEAVLGITLFVGIFVLSLGGTAVKVLREHERGVVFRLGRLVGVCGPGLCFIMPYVDRMVKVDLRVRPLDIPSQTCVTRDRVKVNVGGLVHYQVTDPQRAIVNVADFHQATYQVAQTSLGDVVGQRKLDELLARRGQVNEQLRASVDEQSEAWGVAVIRVEIKNLETF